MTGDKVGPRQAERRLKARARRRAEWLLRSWKWSARGNEYLNYSGLNLCVFPDRQRPERWAGRIGSAFLAANYLSSDEVKLAIFDELELRKRARR